MKLIEFMVSLFYTALYSSIVLVLILACRKILGARLWSDGRMILWAGALLSMMAPVRPHFTMSFLLRNGLSWPPFNVVFNSLGILDGGVFIPNGEIEAVLSVWNGHGWGRYTGNGKAIGMVIFALWIAAAVIFIIWQLLIYCSLKKSLHTLDFTKDETILSMVENERLFWGISKNIRVITANQKLLWGINCPSVVGVRNPVIVLPLEQWNSLSDKERKAVITHEFSHIKYKDNILNFILLFLQAIYWFNPLAWISLKELRKDLEAFRDSGIVKMLGSDDVPSYASSILNIAQMNSKRYSIRPHSGMLCSSGVGLRLRLIENRNRRSIIINIILSALIFAVIHIIFSKWRLSIIETYIRVIG